MIQQDILLYRVIVDRVEGIYTLIEGLWNLWLQSDSHTTQCRLSVLLIATPYAR